MPPPGPRFAPYGGPKKGGPSRKKLIIAGGGGLAAIVAVVVVVAIASSGSRSGTGAVTTTSATPMPTVTPGRLDSILLSSVDVNSIMGATSMQAGQVFREMDSPALTLSTPDCRGLIDVASAPVYQGSGFTAMSGQVAKEPGDNNDHLVAETAISFPSAAEAGTFLKTSTDKWKSCAGHVLTKTGSGTNYRWSVGDVIAQDAKLTVLTPRKTPTAGRASTRWAR
jgi:serine/threonine-protein kinase